MRTFLSFAGRVGATYINGTFVTVPGAGVAFARKIGVDGASRWVPTDLPSSFRSQLDVRSTADAMGARIVGGVTSANVVGGHNAVAWKAGREWTLEDLANNGKISMDVYNGICEYYELEG